MQPRSLSVGLNNVTVYRVSTVFVFITLQGIEPFFFFLGGGGGGVVSTFYFCVRL